VCGGLVLFLVFLVFCGDAQWCVGGLHSEWSESYADPVYQVEPGAGATAR
jgi:hypothetical protein